MRSVPTALHRLIQLSASGISAIPTPILASYVDPRTTETPAGTSGWRTVTRGLLRLARRSLFAVVVSIVSVGRPRARPARNPRLGEPWRPRDCDPSRAPPPV